jgi:hypothetical protein
VSGSSNPFDKLCKKAQPPEIIKRRADRAAESILENERLTADLDDEAAGALLNWAIACAQTVAEDTINLNDEESAEAMSPRLRATRRLTRGVNKWIARQQDQDVEGSANTLNSIVEQAAIIYGDVFESPDPNTYQNFSSQQGQQSPRQMIDNLRTFIEQSSSTKTEE